VLDAGATDRGRPYFVMELVRGIRVTEYCDQNKANTKARLEMFTKVCNAIQHAHQKGIIHRDIKPSNILVTQHDGEPVPKVIDFGIAKATHQDLTDKTVYTQLQQFVGTPAYMSPEQAEMSGLDIDTRSDIYSLGVLLYELLTGSTPFDTKELMRDGIDAMRKTIREQEPIKPSSRLSQTLSRSETSPNLATSHSPLATDLDWIVMKCLEKDRTRRYETANGIAMDIHRHLTDEPIVARPPTALYKLQKAWKRNKLLCSAVAAVSFALMLGIAGSHPGAIDTLAFTWSRGANDAWREVARVPVPGGYECLSSRQGDYVLVQDESLHALKLIELQAPESISAVRLSHPLPSLPAVAVSPDGTFLAVESRGPSASTPSIVTLWELAGQREVRQLEPRLSSRITSIGFSPDGQYLSCLAAGGGVIFTMDGFHRASEFSDYFGETSAVSFAPDRALVALPIMQQRRVRLWDILKNTDRAVLEEPAIVTEATFSLEGRSS